MDFVPKTHWYLNIELQKFKNKISHGFRQEVASMDISLHETAVAQETVYEVGRVLRWDP